jgi:hypothetical protein
MIDPEQLMDLARQIGDGAPDACAVEAIGTALSELDEEDHGDFVLDLLEAKRAGLDLASALELARSLYLEDEDDGEEYSASMSGPALQRGTREEA